MTHDTDDTPRAHVCGDDFSEHVWPEMDGDAEPQVYGFWFWCALTFSVVLALGACFGWLLAQWLLS